MFCEIHLIMEVTVLFCFVLFFWSLGIIKIEFGQILIYLNENICIMFLVQLWILKAIFNPFYDLNKMIIKEDLLIFSSWYLFFVNVTAHSFKRVEKYKLAMTSYWVIRAGW